MIPMGLFRRRADGARGSSSPIGDPGPGVACDETFPYFTLEQGAQFRSLVQRSFAENGAEVVVFADHVQGDGQQFGLANLAAACRAASRGTRDWPELITVHVRRIIETSAAPNPLETLSQEDVAARAYLRLLDKHSLPPESATAYSYGRSVADSIVELIAFDEPEVVRYLRDEDLARFDAEALRLAALANLIAAPIDDHRVLAGPGGEQIHIVVGESVYIASKLIVFRDVLRRTMGEREFPDGVLVAAPLRHQLAFHPVDDAHAAAALNALAGFAASGYGEGAGALTPFVYWWKDGSLEQLSFAEDDGRLSLIISPAFAEVLERLGG